MHSNNSDFIFNSIDFYNFNKNEKSLYFDTGIKGKDYISIYFHTLDNINYRSPLKGSFGGFSFNSSVSLKSLNSFVLSVVNNMKDNGISCIEIVSPPKIYDDYLFQNQMLALSQNNFKIFTTETNQHLVINNTCNFSRGQNRKISKSTIYGLSFHKLELSLIGSVYEVIKKNRLSKGVPITMELEELIKISDNFPELIHLFGVFDKDKIVASSICYRINSSILYVFYWGHDLNYNDLSPVSLLCKGIYDWAASTNFKIIDLGTSSLNGVLNENLYDFKSHLGALTSVKVKYRLNLND